MVPRAMLPLLFFALWASPALMGSWVHAQAINAESHHPNDNERSEASALRSATLSCDTTFGQLPLSISSFWCPPSCTAWTGDAYHQQTNVVGTLTYTGDSPVCLSALHAGKIQLGKGTHVAVSSRPVSTSFVATIRNRVVSGALAVRPRDKVFGYTVASSTPKAAEDTDLYQSELIMIHNNNHQHHIFIHNPFNVPLLLACLPNTLDGSLNFGSLHRWNYKSVPPTGPPVQSQQRSVQIAVSPGDNIRVLRCLGSSHATDVTGIFGRTNDGNSADRPTVTASIGGTATIRFDSNGQFIERFPMSTNESSQIDNVQLQHAGLYRTAANGKLHVYSRLIVRECPAYRYGTNCGSWCPDCLNGGECDAATGRCVCAPGTRGRQCESYCANYKYGEQCHLSCSKPTLHWLAESPTSCSGLTFCVRDPKGCSCLPGYKPPTCDYVCDRNHYGPDCTQQCNYCNTRRYDPVSGRCQEGCDRVTGACYGGCKDARLCSAGNRPLNLPRLRTPPSIASCINTRCFVYAETWVMYSHDGELVNGNVVTGYELQLRDQRNHAYLIPAGPVHSGQSRYEVVYDFIPGELYSFRVRVLTSTGTADPEYNLRLRETVLRIPCLESYVGFEFIVKEITQDSFLIAGMNGQSCWPILQYRLVIWEWSTNKNVSSTTSSYFEQRATNLSPNTTYGVIFGSTTRNVTTLPLPPHPLEKIVIDSINSSSAWAEWHRPERAEHYIITLQYKSCKLPNRGSKLFSNTTDEQRYLTDLSPFQRYEFCVMAVNAGGQSSPRCEEFVTRALYAPAITLSDLRCIPHPKQMTCYVNAPNDCDLLNGPDPTIVWELSGEPACNKPLKENRVFHDTYISGTPWKIFKGLYSMVNYTVEVYVRNNVGRGYPGLKVVSKALPSYVPGPVQQLEVTSTDSTVILRWSPPCPPLTFVSSYEVAVYHTGNGLYKNVRLPLCPGQHDHFCYTINGLSQEMKYRIRVRSCAQGGNCSSVITKDTFTRASAPGAPLIKMTKRQTNNVSFNFVAPPYLGSGASCYLAVINAGQTLVNFTQVEELAASTILPYTVADLAPNSLLLLTSRCCNTVGCSTRVQLPNSTLLAPLEVKAPMMALDITDTTATLQLPEIRAGNANISFVVMVQNITGKADSEPANFTAHYTSWKLNQRSPGRKRRSVTNLHCSDPSPSVYVSGTVEQNQDKPMFVLGSGEENNCKLTAGNSYRVAVVAEAILLDQVSVSEFQLANILIAGDHGGSNLAATLGSIATILLLLIIAIAFFVKMKQRQRKQTGPEPSSGRGENKGVINALRNLRNLIHSPNLTSSSPDKKLATLTDSPSVTATGTTPPPVPEGETSSPGLTPSSANRAKSRPIPGQSAMGSAHCSKPTAAVRAVQLPKDTIYEDLAEEDPIFGNGSAIPVQEIEAYLNQIINSHSIISDFMLVPKKYPKSMSDGELPPNELKNRYRNNLPYNETRVRLSIINEDPYSDYINASHVQGITAAKHYIAAQGPKDSDNCTIPDFWRMVVENNVDVIIMVANFVEKNVVKVGTYFSIKGPIALKPLGGSVHVVSRNITPYCTISVVQVTIVLHGSTETRQVTHYHYTKWPDHGVPKETHTLAQMLHHIANSHQTMCALVHCSAGIGRTGTVIFDLLCYDHLVETQKLDLIAVLVHLRKSRAHLVENQMQFKLGIKLLDEILFGFSNAIPTSNLQNSMSLLQAECQAMFSQFNCLPSSLEYKTGARGENIALNRSPDILPADSRMIFFQNHAGQSPYINAVSLDSHSEADSYIITEHPLKSTLESFWEMVKQKISPILVVLNNSIDEDYPQMFAEEVDGKMKFGSTVVTTTNVHRVCSNLIKRDINVEAGRSQHSVALYEAVGWRRGAAVPPDYTVLTRLADVILGGSLRSAHPPVLVCSDGVTACGLMAGVLRVVERVKQCQDVDIYRTAVILRRCRRELIVDHIQLQVMLRVAVDYLSSFQNYDNFK